MTSRFALNSRICEKIATVIGCVSRPNVSATRRSFHTQRNSPMATEATAGHPGGQGEEPAPPGDLEPGERVAGEGGHDDRQDRPPERNPQRGHERRRDRIVLEDRAVVVERDETRCREDLPPAGAVDLRRDNE